MLQKPNFQVVGCASDGLESVQKAEELQPDLILVDIGLQKLNGVEAAKIIRRVSPRSRILFLSQESDSDLVQEVLNSGGLGYIHKPRMHNELLLAIESVLAGRRFVGSDLNGYKLREATQPQALHRHDVVFYSNDMICMDALADFTAKSLKAGKTAIVVATKPHREGFLQKMKTDYVEVDIDGAIQQGACITLDSIETLSAITVNGEPDRDKLFESVGGLIESATKRTHDQRLAACGECAPLLWADGKKEAAIRIEQLWDELAKTYGMDLLCTYPLSGFQEKEHNVGFKRMCAEHTAVYFG